MTTGFKDNLNTQDRVLLLNSLQYLEQFISRLRSHILNSPGTNRIANLNDATMLGKLDAARSILSIEVAHTRAYIDELRGKKDGSEE